MRINSLKAGAYPEYAQASTGGPSYPVFANIAEAAGQTVPNSRLQFGDGVVDKFGNVFVYVRATVTLAIGQIVRMAVSGDGDFPAGTFTIAAASTTSLVKTNITTTIDEAAVAGGSWLASPGPTTPFVRLIKGISGIGATTNFTVSKKQIMFGVNQFDGDLLSAAPTSTEVCEIFRPYNVAVHGVASLSSKEGGPVGVALGTATVGQGTLIQVQGTAQVLGIGSTDAIVAGGPLVPASVGTVKGPLTTIGTVAASAQAEIPNYVGRSYIAYVGASKLIPVKLCLLNKL